MFINDISVMVNRYIYINNISNSCNSFSVATSGAITAYMYPSGLPELTQWVLVGFVLIL